MMNRRCDMCCARYDVVRARRLNDDAHCIAYDMALHACVYDDDATYIAHVNRCPVCCDGDIFTLISASRQ